MVQTKLTIQVQIGNRSYPITVSETEKEKVEKAAAKINLQLKELETTYKVKDQQDLLAMCILQLTTEQMKNSAKMASNSDEINQSLQQLDAMVTDYLNQV